MAIRQNVMLKNDQLTKKVGKRSCGKMAISQNIAFIKQELEKMFS